MNTNDYKNFYQNYEEMCAAYQLANSIIYFDKTTIAPKAGSAMRNKLTSILDGESFSYMTDPENLEKLEAMLELDDLDDITKESVRQRLRLLRDIRIIPKAEYVAFQNLIADSSVAWEEAKEKNDYAIFEPYLKKTIQALKKLLSYRVKEGTPYDMLLDDYEPGMNIKKYDEFFAKIKQELLPFIQKIVKEGKPIDDSSMHQHFDAGKQAAFMEVVKKYLHFDADKCYMGVSMHPYTMKVGPGDTRLTTAYDEEFITSSIFSIIHEYGHALYGMQVDAEYDNTHVLGENMSMGIHESQSRMLENYIGRNRSFWVNNYPALQVLFPNELGEVDLDSFMEQINISHPSLIRTDADELTYPIHILIRYELEKAIFNEDMPLDHLDQVWADKYEEYLGIRPSNPAEGILQDMHWGSGQIGYFPTYALGSAFSAQFYHQMTKDLDVDALLAQNHFEVIAQWLHDNIHKYGSYLPSEEILKRVTGESFNPQYYIDYLIQKYSNIYQINES